MVRPARTRRSTAKATFRPSSRVYFGRRRPVARGASPDRSVSAGAATFSLTPGTPQIAVSPHIGNASIGWGALGATVKIKVNPAEAAVVLRARDVIPKQNIACAWFTTDVTVDQHSGAVDLDTHEGAITLDAHEGVVGVDEHYADVVVCGRP